jgi:DNA-binding XRE family transcriptional regulator
MTTNNDSIPVRRTIAGKRMVLLEEAEYERLLQRADSWEPAMPARDTDGNYPAGAAMAVIQARDLLRARRQLGLTQAELARAARIRVETLHRIERAKNKPNVATIEKLDRALRRLQRKLRKKTRSTLQSA